MGSKLVNDSPSNTAKRVLLHSIFTVTQQMRRNLPPVKLTKKKNSLSVVAEKDLEKGELVIPLFIRRSTSILTEDTWGSNHGKSIAVDLEWKEANIKERFEDCGIEEPITHSFCLIVKEESRLPPPDSEPEQWTGSEDLHPFWLIRREPKNESKHNFQLQKQTIQSSTIMDWEELALQGAKTPHVGAGALTVYVWYPFIVNTKDIRKDEEVVLHNDREEPTKDKKRKEMNAFDQLKSKYSKKLSQNQAASSSI